MISGCQCTLALSLPVLPCPVGSSPAFSAPSFHLSAPLSLILQPPERPTFHLLLPAPAQWRFSIFASHQHFLLLWKPRGSSGRRGSLGAKSLLALEWEGAGGRPGWGEEKRRDRELRIQTQPAPDGERDFSTPSMRGRQGRGRAAQCQAGSAAASFRWLNRRRLSGQPLW